MRLSRLALGIHRVAVEGASMVPALDPGDRLLVIPVWRPRPGDIVAVADPRHRERLLIKRVISVDHGEKAMSVEGDNRAASTDSRTFGPIPRSAVVGRIFYRYGPKGRTGTIPRGLRGGPGTASGAR